MVLAKYIQSESDQQIGLIPTNQPLGCNIYGEFINMFLGLDNYHEIEGLLNQSTSTNQPIQIDPKSLKNPDEVAALAFFSLFALEAIIQCFKDIIDFGKEENKDEEGDFEGDDIENGEEWVQNKKSAPLPIVKRIDIMQKNYL